MFGAELSLELTKPQNGMADPEGSHLLVLAERQEGYHRLAGAITEAQLRGKEKGRPVYDLEELAAIGEDWLILTGCRKGLVRRALELGGQAEGPAAAARELDRLTALFGKDRVVVELIDHQLPTDSTRNAILARLAATRACRWSPPTTCTTPSPGGTNSPPRSPPSGPGAASTRWTAGCHRPARAPAIRGGDARQIPPVRRCGRADGRVGRPTGVQPARGQAEPAEAGGAAGIHPDGVAEKAVPRRREEALRGQP